MGGVSASFIGFDEARDVDFTALELRVLSMQDHTRDAMGYVASTIGQAAQKVAAKVNLDPLAVHCMRCEAPAGERCRKDPMERTGNSIYRKPHYRRRQDARIAAEAVHALS